MEPPGCSVLGVLSAGSDHTVNRLSHVLFPDHPIHDFLALILWFAGFPHVIGEF